MLRLKPPHVIQMENTNSILALTSLFEDATELINVPTAITGTVCNMALFCLFVFAIAEG